MASAHRQQRLHRGVQFSLFATSYTPLFVLIILRQLFQNGNKLTNASTTGEFVTIIAADFLLSLMLITLICMGMFGLVASLKNLNVRAKQNGVRVSITNVQNRSGEAISYIGTYIIPFLFQDYSGWYEVLSVLFLLYVIYRIYIHSSLLLINPLLNLRYSLFEIGFIEEQNGRQRTGMMITRNRFLQEGDSLLIYPLGQKLYLGVMNDEEGS